MGATKSLQASYITDDDGNAVGVILDGTIYRIQQIGKLLNASGAQINPSTEDTLSNVDTKLGTIDGVLDSIKDTDGIKKITDALPAGTNIVGKVNISDGTDIILISGGGAARFTEFDDDASPVQLPVKDNTDIPTNTHGKIMAGKDPLGKSQFVKTTSSGEVITAGSETNITGFSETRVASPYLVGNYVNKYELDDYWYDTDISGGGTITHLPLQSAIKLQVGGTDGDEARLRTNNYFRYQAGRSILTRISGYCSDSGQTNQIRRWGIFDDNDGLFFEQSGGIIYVVSRTSTSGSAVDTKIAQASWNKDVMDGNGGSGINIDYTKANIWEITLQWLGAGIVSFYIDGVLVHRLDNPNTFTAPYMKTAVLPLSWEVVNDGTSATGGFTFICASVSIEGGDELPEYTFGAYNPDDVIIGITETPILSIRPNTTFNGIDNRMVMIPIFATVSTDGARASYRIVLNGTLTAASWGTVNAESVAQYDTAATALSGGVTLLRGMLPNAIDAVELDFSRIFNAFSRALRMKAFSTDVDVLTVMCRNEKNTGGTTNMRASLTWQEVR